MNAISLLLVVVSASWPAIGQADPTTRHTQLAAVGGTDQPCGSDGVCNLGACESDPDCPPGMLPRPETSSSPAPIAIVDAPCGGKVIVQANDSPLGVAAGKVAARLPNFNLAQKAKIPSFFDSHPSGIAATGHAELKGVGVTMIQGKWPKPVENASGKLDDPTLLFFRKHGNDQDDWNIIGMGYSYQFDHDNERAPTQIPAVDAGVWWVHEAGYHRSPGDGGFTCANNDDLKKSSFDAGKRVDASGCFGIDRDNIKTREFHADHKHGRYWALHVWFEPGTLRPTYAITDPWCRQSADALFVPACAFFKQGSC